MFVFVGLNRHGVPYYCMDVQVMEAGAMSPDISEVRQHHINVLKGRGATSNLQGRFETTSRERADDGWGMQPDQISGDYRRKTEVSDEVAKSILSRNSSPDIPFNVSLNPYRGCEHVMSPEQPGVNWAPTLLLDSY